MLSSTLRALGEGATKGHMEADLVGRQGKFDEGYMVTPGIAFEMTKGDAEFFAFCGNHRALLAAALELAEAVDKCLLDPLKVKVDLLPSERLVADALLAFRAADAGEGAK